MAPLEVSVVDTIVKSLSELVARIVGTLSITSWAPAATLVMGVALIEDMADDTKATPLEAISAVGYYDRGRYAVLAAAIIAAAIVLQPLQFAMIRLLEGYWGEGRVLRRLATPFLWFQKRRQHRFGAVRAEKAKWFGKFNKPNRVRKFNAKRKAKKTADPAREERIEREKKLFPEEPSRRLPTALGNRLRAAEDRAVAKDKTPIQSLVLREFDSMPTSLRDMHVLFRSRLDLYAQLTFVWLALAIVAGSGLRGTDYRWPGVVLGVVAAASSYFACNATAEGYGDTLIAIRDVYDRRAQHGAVTMPAGDPPRTPSLSSKETASASRS